ncbi:MAG: OmpA family protein [Bacteroidota bacterium]
MKNTYNNGGTPSVFQYLLWLFLCVSSSTSGQNLIRNASFEEVIKSDKGGEGYDLIALEWKYLGNFHYKLQKFDLIVDNIDWIGVQAAKTGAHMAFLEGSIKDEFHHAEYIAQKLSQPLQRGHKYVVKFYVNLGERSGIYIQEIGAYFSEKPIIPKHVKGKGYSIHGVYPHVTSDALLRDWSGWMEISGEFVAKGGEQFMTIGSFTPYNKMHYKKIARYLIEAQYKKLGSDWQGMRDDHYFYFVDDISLNFVEVADSVEQLPEMELGASIIFENVLFATSSSSLLKNSFEELNRLIALMQSHPSLKIEIAGHTDNVGDSIKNLQLSKNRASVVVRYLQAKGIKSTRLKAKGFGEDQPIASNDTNEGKRKNRRVEITVLDN